ncbi:diiron oxygenase [Nocardioides sp. NPDC051685]|uniref:diiron oxygenase n=1 Tax=Nocardioides sp. NPDC051685 TaxID=3364334 RepID=UPI0037B457D9
MTVAKEEQSAGYRRQGDQAYYDTLRTLSQASLDQHFEAFVDIDWDDPANGWVEDDDRLILTEADEIGAHAWYKSLPRERQIQVGAYRYAQISKVGRQFEQILIAGVAHHLIKMEDRNPEFRYAMHEVTEETHHIQMFQEAVNCYTAWAGIDEISGMSRFWKNFAPVFTMVGSYFPELFFVGILAGEEPIDHLQKSIMRSGGSHPLIDRIMQIHIAEEARHIGFAHQYLEHHWPQLGFAKRQVLAALFPVIMRALCDIIMVPSKQAQADMGIPEEVAKEIWWGSEESAKTRRDMFGDVRMLADNMGIRKGPARLVWRLMGIDGGSSRHRSALVSARS